MDFTRLLDPLLGIKKKEEQQQPTQQLLSAPPQIKNRGAVNLLLDKGASYEDISAKTGVPVGHVRAYTDVTRPGYGVKKQTFQAPAKPLDNPISWLGKTAQDFGKGVSDVLVGTAQAVPRAVKSTGLTIRGEQEYKPQGDIEKAIYGDQSVRDLPGYAKQTTTDIGNLVDQKDLGGKLPSWAALPVGIALAASDVNPLGGIRKKAIDEVGGAVVKNINNAAPALKTADNLPTYVRRGGTLQGVPKQEEISIPQATDFDMRATFNSPAREIAKNDPGIAEAFARTGSRDPLNLTLDMLANSDKKSQVRSAVSRLLPNINNSTKNYATKMVLEEKSPDAVKQLLWDMRNATDDGYQYTPTVTMPRPIQRPNEPTSYVSNDIRATQPSSIDLNDVDTPAYLRKEQAALNPAAREVDTIANNAPSLDAENLPLPSAIPPSINANSYVKRQVELQKQARGSNSLPQKVADFKLDAKRALVDSYSPIEDRLNKATKSGAEVTPQNNIKYQIDRVLRADQIATQHMKDSGLVDVIQKAPNVNKLEQYLIAKHAQDLEGQGIKTGRNLDADKQMIQELAPEYEPYAQQVNNYSQTLLDRAVQYKLVSPETATNLREKYPNYVPMNRIFADDELPSYRGTGGATASLSGQSIVKRIKGSERQVESPLGTLINKTQDVVKEGERNKAASILASYKDLPNNPFGIEELVGEAKPGDHTISLLNNGIKETYKVDKVIADAAKNLTREQMGLVAKILSFPTRVLRLGATGLNPAFALSNVTKDAQSAFINSKHPLRSSVANPQVFLNALKAAFNHGSKQYGEIMREAAGGTSFDIARDAPMQSVKMLRAGRNAGTKALYTVTHPSELLRAAENTIGRSEEFTRAMQYFGNKQAALKGGQTIDDAKIFAADAARNNTVNFARAGDYGRVLNSVLPYLNAGIQGSRTLLRNLKDRPLQTSAKIVITGFIPVVATTAWNLNDPARREAYDDISDYEKENNIIIIPPNPQKDESGRWNAIKIPVSQEIASLNNSVRNGVEALQGDKNFDFAALCSNLFGTATSIKPDNALNQVIPQALKPVIETVQNKNLYTGNQIVPDSLQNMSPPEQYGDFTSGAARLLGKSINASPLLIDNAYKTATAGLGQNALNAADSALARLGIIPPDQVGGKSFIDSMKEKFVGAQSVPTSSKVKDQVENDLNALRADPNFQALSHEEQAKALNRLQSASSKANYQDQDAKSQKGQFAPGYTGDQTKLSERESSLLTDKPDVSSFLTTKTKSGSGKRASDKTNKEKYNDAKSEFMKDNAKWGDIERTKKVKELSQLKVKSGFPDDVVELYGMSKSDIEKFISGRPDGENLKQQLLSYGDALKAAGLSSTNKLRDKNGNASFTTKAKKSSSSSSGKKKTGKTFKAPSSKAKVSAVSNASRTRSLLAKAKVTRSKTA